MLSLIILSIEIVGGGGIWKYQHIQVLSWNRFTSQSASKTWLLKQLPFRSLYWSHGYNQGDWHNPWAGSNFLGKGRLHVDGTIEESLQSHWYLHCTSASRKVNFSACNLYSKCCFISMWPTVCRACTLLILYGSLYVEGRVQLTSFTGFTFLDKSVTISVSSNSLVFKRDCIRNRASVSIRVLISDKGN